MALDGSTELDGPTIQEIAATGLGIRASCSCGHCRVVSPAKICVPPTTEIDAVGDLLTCSTCGTKGLVTIVAPLKG